MQLNIVDKFRNHGLDFDPESTDPAELEARLEKTKADTLWDILDDFIGEENIEFVNDAAKDRETNEKIQTLALSYALVHAYENDLETISQADVDAAMARASTSSPVEAPVTKKAEVEDTPEAEPRKTPEAKPSPTKLPRSKHTYPEIRGIVEANPTLNRDEILDIVTQRMPMIARNSVMQYFYRARSDLGLPPAGKLGRKRKDTVGMTAEILKEYPDKGKDEMLPVIMERLGVTEGTAATYYYKGKKRLK